MGCLLNTFLQYLGSFWQTCPRLSGTMRLPLKKCTGRRWRVRCWKLVLMESAVRLSRFPLTGQEHTTVYYGSDIDSTVKGRSVVMHSGPASDHLISPFQWLLQGPRTRSLRQDWLEPQRVADTGGFGAQTRHGHFWCGLVFDSNRFRT